MIALGTESSNMYFPSMPPGRCFDEYGPLTNPAYSEDTDWLTRIVRKREGHCLQEYCTEHPAMG